MCTAGLPVVNAPGMLQQVSAHMGTMSKRNGLSRNRHASGAGGVTAFSGSRGSGLYRIVLDHPREGHLVLAPEGALPAGRHLSLGSQDLIRFTGFASDRGFSVASFLPADSALEPLGRAVQDRISAAMVSIITDYGSDELEAAMRDEFDHLYVVGVMVAEPTTGLQISLRRRGYVETSNARDAEELIASAWRELRLS